jgi:hypothetical protein
MKNEDKEFWGMIVSLLIIMIIMVGIIFGLGYIYHLDKIQEDKICIDNGFDGKINKEMYPGYVMCYVNTYNENKEKIKYELPLYVGGK